MIKAYNSIDIIAKLVVANCYQVNQLIVDQADQRAGEVSNYEDLWRITMGNYNAGSGCTRKAIIGVWDYYKFINWLHISEQYDKGCQGAIDYVSGVCR